MKAYFYIFIVSVFFVNFIFLTFKKKKIDRIFAFVNIANTLILTIFLFTDFQKFSMFKLVFSSIFVFQNGVIIKYLIDNYKEV
ncbi:MAG: hypothetical protein ABIN00_02115 [candidate division WOR-3 bacterium]